MLATVRAPGSSVAGAVMTWWILRRGGERVPLGLLCAGVLCVASVANVGSTVARVTLMAGAVAAIGLMLRWDGAATDRLFPGDSGLATTAQLSFPNGLGVDVNSLGVVGGTSQRSIRWRT